MRDSYRVLIGDTLYGPMSQEQLSQLIDAGRVSEQDRISKNNGPWTSVAEYCQVTRTYESLATLPKPENSADPGSPSGDTSRSSVPGRKHTFAGLAICGILAVAILLALSMYVVPHIVDRWTATAGGRSQNDQARGRATGHRDTSPGNPPTDRADSSRQSSVEGTARSGLEGSLSGPPTEMKGTRLVEALWLVLVGNQTDQFYRVGTAWAVAPRTLASSASVVMRLRELRERFPQIVVFSPEQNRQIPVVEMQVHPEYVRAAADCDQAETELDDLLARQEAAAPTDADLQQIRETWVNARLKALTAAERQVYFDAGTIHVDQQLGPCLPLAVAPAPNALRPNMAVRVLGLAFDFKDPFFDPSVATVPHTLNGRIGQLVSFNESTSPPRRLIVHLQRLPPSQELHGQLEYTYVGSPVMNEQGQAVAIYSRPSPPPEMDEVPDGTSFDAALADRVQELLTSQEK